MVTILVAVCARKSDLSSNCNLGKGLGLTPGRKKDQVQSRLAGMRSRQLA